MNIIIGILVALLFIFFISNDFIVSYITHVTLSMEENAKYKWMSFKTFLAEFEKYKDNPNMEYGYKYHNETYPGIFLQSCENEEFKEKVHLFASIVEIDERCIILYPISWFRYCKWLKQFTGRYGEDSNENDKSE